MADVYLWDEASSSDVVLRSSAPTGEQPVTATAQGGRRKQTSNGFAPKSGRISWRVTIRGTGSVDTTGSVRLAAELTPTAVADHLDLVVVGRATVDTSGTVALRFAGQPGAVHATAHLRLAPAVELRRITDPPELWELLDLVELT